LRTAIAAAAIAFVLPSTPPVSAELVPVRHTEGRTRGFLVVRDAGDKVIGVGQLNQTLQGSRVVDDLRIHFSDGSTLQETTEFSQRKTFRLRSYHLVQHGPAFERQVDMSLDVARGDVAIRYSEKGEAEKTIRERLDLPDDLANGMLPTLLNDVDPARAKTVVSLLAATPKPRIVRLEISPDGEESFTIAGAPFQAQRFKAHVEIGGIAGALAPVLGKQPPDSHLWTVGGKVPGFLKSEGPLFEGGPIWTVAIASPVWASSEPQRKPAAE